MQCATLGFSTACSALSLGARMALARVPRHQGERLRLVHPPRKCRMTGQSVGPHRPSMPKRQVPRLAQ